LDRCKTLCHPTWGEKNEKPCKVCYRPLLTAGLAMVPAQGAAKKKAAKKIDSASATTNTDKSKTTTSSNPGHKKGNTKGKGAKKKK